MRDTRIVKGIADSYVVKEAFDSAEGMPFLEVYEYVADGLEEETNGFIGDWICDIDCTLSDTDETILNEIDAAL